MEEYSLKPATPVYASSVYNRPAAVSAGQSSAATSTSAAASPSAATSEFRDLMSLMILSMSMSTMSNLSGSSDLSGSGGLSGAGMQGMDMSTLMAPLMLSLMEKLMAQQVETADESSSLPFQVAAPKDEPGGSPVKSTRITQGSHAGHVALDFGIPVGTPVKTTMDGKVVHAGWNTEGYGNLVIVENGPYRTYYAHLSEIPVSIGEKVQAGTVIGQSGNTGNSTGPHLHYEVRKNGVQINPTSFTLR